jgi:hypothetical protein
MTLVENAAEFGGIVLGLLLTLGALSFVYRDNALYRLSVHVLVGAAAGYALVIVTKSVIWPVLSLSVNDPLSIDFLLWLIPIGLGVLLLLKLSRRLSRYGTIPMAFMMGVGIAVALVGAITGTLWPLATAPYGDDSPWISLLAGLLTMLALGSFVYVERLSLGTVTVKIPSWFAYVRNAGQALVLVALAALYVAALQTGLVVLSARAAFYVQAIRDMLGIAG